MSNTEKHLQDVADLFYGPEKKSSGIIVVDTSSTHGWPPAMAQSNHIPQGVYEGMTSDEYYEGMTWD